MMSDFKYLVAISPGLVQKLLACLLLFAAASGQNTGGSSQEGPDYDFFRQTHTRGLERSYQQYTTTCNCSWGRETQENRLDFKIVGGSRVSSSGNFPMMAGLVHPETGCSICGATVLTEFHVLTAAHCVSDGDELYLWVGTQHRCRRNSEAGQLIPLLTDVFIHEKYSDEDNHYDIAIAVAAKRIIFNDQVGPACLLTEPFSAKDDPIWVLGWGKDAEDGEPNELLHKVYVKEVDIDTCEGILPSDWISPDRSTQMCTYRCEGKDACAGDSGGPLLWMDPRIDRFSLVAVVSMGRGCARNNVPAINTAVYPFIGWIRDTIDYTYKYSITEEEGYSTSQICHVIPK